MQEGRKVGGFRYLWVPGMGARWRIVVMAVVVLLLLWEGRTRGDSSYFGGLNPKLFICRVSTGPPSKGRVRGSLWMCMASVNLARALGAQSPYSRTG